MFPLWIISSSEAATAQLGRLESCLPLLLAPQIQVEASAFAGRFGFSTMLVEPRRTWGCGSGLTHSAAVKSIHKKAKKMTMVGEGSIPLAREMKT